MKKRLLTMIFALTSLMGWAQSLASDAPEAPEFTFTGDNLVMTTNTANASIFYDIADLSDLTDETVESVTSAMVNLTNFYQQSIEIKRNVVIKAVALVDDGGTTLSSDTTTLAYGYTLWVELSTAITRGNEVYARADGNSSVDTQLLSDLQWAIEEGEMMMGARGSAPYFEAQHFAQTINDLCDQIEAIIGTDEKAIDEPYAVLSGGNTVLTFYYDDQKTARGGMDINTQSWDIENGEVPPYGGIMKAVFDASFANYQPTSTAYWFQGCGNMTTIEGMEYLNTSNVTSMWGMFDWCSSLESIDLSHMDTSNAVYLAYMFNGCSSLQSLDVSGFNTENATDIGAMFRYCSKLTTVDVSHFNTSKVTSFWGLFAECTSLTSLNVSNFDTSSAEMMAYIFYNCNQLQSLDVSHFNTSNATNMYGLFGRCFSLTSLDLSSFNTEKVTDMSNMFAYCNSLTSLDVSNFNTANVTDMSLMFAYCNVLPSLNVSSFNTENVTNMRYMFAGSFTLNSLDLSGFNTANVTDMTNMFDACYGLYNLNVSGFNTANVTNMPYMFAGCAGLVSLDLSSFNTANVTDMSNLFYSCIGLAAIQAGNANIPAAQYAQIGNPNLLVYVNDASLAPAGIQNVVVNGNASEIVLTDADAGNNNWYCPQMFTAEKISYTRNFQQQTQIGVSRGWETIALPFDVQTITHATKGVISPFGNSSSNYHFWLRRLTRNGLQSMTQIEANTAYLISMPNSSEYSEEYNLAGEVTFSAEQVDIPETSPIFDESADFFICPVFEPMEAQEYVYALNVGEARGGYPEGSVFEQNYRELRPFEAFTKHLNSPARFITFEDLNNGNVTGLQELKNGKTEEWKSEGWYDLNGRRVLRPSKGLYIKNGQKVIMK